MIDLFIDFENVLKSGLEGIESLSRFDRVFLFTVMLLKIMI